MERKKIELLAPAGDMERLQMAAAYGADAVYLAGTTFGMRSFAGNFTPEALKEAVELCHRRGIRVHVTCNTMPRNNEVARLPERLEYLDSLGVDAIILADVGTLALAAAHAPHVERHISTQASVVNYQSARAWHQLGAKRVILARELSLDEIREIRDKTPPELDDQLEEAAAKEAAEEPAEAEAGATDPLMDELEALKDQAARQEEKYLRLAAEYDNFRKRTAKEKEAIWNDAKADAALAFLPVYDNLERALKQETADEAYKKGVEMTMNQLKTVLEKLGITEIEALGQPFDPTLHNAVMHIEDENFGENTVAEVFQAGFRLGDKVVRFAMVKVAN